MTVNYTPPPPPGAAPAPPPAKKTGCLKIALIGCSIIVVLGVACVAVLVLVVFGAIKHSDVYKGALNRVSSDPRVIAALGQPVEAGWYVTGNVNISNGKGNANITFPISGPKGKARVEVVASNDGSRWEYSTLTVTPANGPPIDVLTQ